MVFGSVTFCGNAIRTGVYFKLSYLEIPVLAKLAVPLNNTNIKPVIYAGPSFSLKLNSSWHWLVKETSQEYEEDDEYAKSTGFGFVIGAGAGIPLGSITVGLEIRFDFGLASFEDDYSIKNNVFMVMVSVQI
jgi:hypothetical protein